MNVMQPAASTATDPFTTEIIRSSLISITDEMKQNLMRTAYHMIIYDAEDFTVGLFDANGDAMSIGLGFPMMIRGISDTIKAMIEHYKDEDQIEPGDILLTNDGYIHGSHINHMVFTMPIYHQGRLVAFSSSMAHWQNIGGLQAGLTRDIFTEGTVFPFMKVWRKGVENKEIVAMIATNMRAPEANLGDMRAQIASIRTGERRLSLLLERYGVDAFVQCVEQIYDTSERAARLVVREIPDGVYEAESFMDDDGNNKNVPLKVKVIVEGDDMTIDFSECSPEVPGNLNSGPSTGRSIADVAFKFVTSPTLFPINEGSFRPLKMILPPGTVISARKPAALKKWMLVPMTLTDTVFRALQYACPDRVIAAHGAELAAQLAYWQDPKTRRQKGGPGAQPGQGWGAVSDADGMCATITINDGDTHNFPIESAEAKFPVFFNYRKLREDSGGPGRWRGGLGGAQDMRVTVPAMIDMPMERTQCAPWGLCGGGEALPNNTGICKSDGSVIWGRFHATRVAPGEGFISEAGGGGGFGDPTLREPERVFADVRSGYVSLESARDDYGVVIHSPAPRKYKLDVEATAKLRAEMGGKK